MTDIEWTNETWNPTTGCTKGCGYCYEEEEREDIDICPICGEYDNECLCEVPMFPEEDI